MTRIATRSALTAIVVTVATALPGAVLAHGVHAPVAGHAAAHLGPVLGLAAILLAAFVACRRARG